MSVKKHSMELVHGVPGHYRPAQPIQLECISSLSSLWSALAIYILVYLCIHCYGDDIISTLERIQSNLS